MIGAAAGYVFLWLVFQLFKLVTGKEGMGYGDFKLFAAIGAWLGWQMLPLVLLLAAVVGAVVGIAMMAASRLGRGVPIPFGPYLAGAAWIALLWGPDIVEGYLEFRGPALTPMLRIGLTGGIASGKSTVADLFAARGATVLDTDVIAREVVEPGRPALGALVNALGGGILDGDGTARPRGAAPAPVRGRGDPTRRRGPPAPGDPRRNSSGRRGRRAGPTRCSSSRCWWRTAWSKVVDRVLVVDCPEEEQVRRLMARDGEGRESALRMLAAQASREQRLASADDVIDNGGPAADLPAQVAALDHKYRGLAASP